VNDGLLLLIQQGDDPALGTDGAIEAVGGPAEEVSDGLLLLGWHQWDVYIAEVAEVEILAISDVICGASKCIDVGG